jgi:SSS family solute:Na+ symporter
MNVGIVNLLVVYVGSLVALGWFLSRRDGDEDYLIAGRDRSGWVVAASKFASSVGVGFFLAYTGYAYEYGLGAYAIVFGAVLGYGLFAVWAAPRLYAGSAEGRFLTQGDFVADRTGSRAAQVLTNGVSALGQFGWLVVGVIGGAKVIAHVGTVDYEAALVLTGAVSALYVVLGGFRAVLATDVLQAGIMLALIAVVAALVLGRTAPNDIGAAHAGTLDAGTFAGFLLFGVLAVFAAPGAYQLVYAANSRKAAVLGHGAAILPVVVVTTCLLMIGMAMAAQAQGLEPGMVFMEAIQRNLPTALLPLGILLFFAGLMSTADTNMFAIAAHVELSRGGGDPVRRMRRTTILVAALAVAAGLVMRDIIDMTVLVVCLSMSVAVGMIYLIAGGRRARAFNGSVIGGLAGAVAGIAAFGLEPTALLAVLAASGIGLGLGPLPTRGR